MNSAEEYADRAERALLAGHPQDAIALAALAQAAATLEAAQMITDRLQLVRDIIWEAR